MKDSAEREAFLVLRAQSGDREALDALLASVQEPLHRYLLTLVRERHLAEDALQETFVRVYRKLGWLRDPALFRPWAYRIASREVVRQLKRRRRWPEQFGEDFSPEQLAAEAADAREPELAERLTELLSKVSPASRMVLVLHYLDEMPLQEVADVLGVPVGTAKSRLAYGLAALRREAGKLAV